MNELTNQRLTAEPSEKMERSAGRSEKAVQENVVALRYGPDLMDELVGLAQMKRLCDLIVIDCTASGYFFTGEALLEVTRLSHNLLVPTGGTILFVKTDKAFALIKEAVVGPLSFHIFDSLSAVFKQLPLLASQIDNALRRRIEMADDENDLDEHIFLSSVPVLTQFGIKLKASMEVMNRRNQLLSVIDSYAPFSAIIQRLRGKLSREEILEEMPFLEQSGAIYPVLPKIRFLVHCFKTKTRFKLKDYLVQGRIISLEQIDELMASSKGHALSSLGALCVQKGLISSRQLEIALQDIAFYGQGAESEKVKVHIEHEQESRGHSLVGHLGTTDAAGLLQSLSNNRENGILSVQSKDRQFSAVFEHGKVTKAKLGKLKANEAVVEFVSVWKHGFFVFIDRQAPADLADESCTVTRPIDKLLLHSALAADNIESLWKTLPHGAETQLEKLPDVNNLFETKQMIDPVENTPLTEAEIEACRLVWDECDGLASINATLKKLRTLNTSKATTAINRLLHHNLVAVSTADISRPLETFNMIVRNVSHRIGLERTMAMLRLSLSSTQGYSARARMFQMGSGGEVGLDLALARMAGVSMTEAIKQLDCWKSSFVEYLSHEMDQNALRQLIAVSKRDSE